MTMGIRDGKILNWYWQFHLTLAIIIWDKGVLKGRNVFFYYATALSVLGIGRRSNSFYAQARIWKSAAKQHVGRALSRGKNFPCSIAQFHARRLRILRERFQDFERSIVIKMKRNYTREDIMNLVREEDVEFIRLQFTDMFGNLKNVAITSSQLEKALDNKCMFDGSSIEGFVRIE